MSGSSAGNFVGEAPDEDALDAAGRKTVERVDYTLALVSLAMPDQRPELMSLAAHVRLLASRERAARAEAKIKNNDAIRQRVTAGVYEGRVNMLEEENDKLRAQLTRLRAKFAVSMAPSLKNKRSK